MIDIAPFLKFWGILSILATIGVGLFKQESRALSNFVPGSIRGAYSTILRIIKMPNVQSLSLVLLLTRIGFIALDSVAPLKLIEKGFPREKLALTVLIDFPCQIVIGFLAARWSQGPRPLWAWQRALLFKFSMALTSMLVLYSFPTNGVISGTFFSVIIMMTVLSSLGSTLMFVSMGSFFSIISDPSVGGTYMTLLNTMSNLGGMWPKLLILSAVDWFNCTSDQCLVLRDGYYIVNSVCIVVGVILMVGYLIPTVRRLEVIPPRQWQINTIPSHLMGAV